MYKIQYRFNPYAAWTDCVWDGNSLTFKDRKAAVKMANEVQAIAKQINSTYEYRVAEV